MFRFATSIGISLSLAYTGNFCASNTGTFFEKMLPLCATSDRDCCALKVQSEKNCFCFEAQDAMNQCPSHVSVEVSRNLYGRNRTLTTWRPSWINYWLKAYLSSLANSCRSSLYIPCSCRRHIHFITHSVILYSSNDAFYG